MWATNHFSGGSLQLDWGFVAIGIWLIVRLSRRARILGRFFAISSIIWTVFVSKSIFGDYLRTRDAYRTFLG